MTEPLRRDPARVKLREEPGDVLASIRRLIAQEQASLSVADSGPVAGPVAAPEPTVAPRPIMDTGTLSQAVDAAALRMADTARRIEAARGTASDQTPADAPFRLNPDALIPPADRPFSDARLRLSPALTGLDEDVAATPAPALVQSLNDAGAHLRTADVPVAEPMAQAALLDATPIIESAPPAAQTSFQQEPDIMQITADRPQATIMPHPAAMPPAAPVAATTPLAGGDGQIVRQLLREAIRAELSAELGDRLNSELRQMVRQEIASALSAALSDALRLPATR